MRISVVLDCLEPQGDPVTELLEGAGIWWQVMTDPEGNTFCVVADPGHSKP